MGRSSSSGSKKKTSKVLHQSSDISPHTQEIIWSLHHAATENFAGKLSVCIGMPVMIRNNDATELCITKGQEGFVVGWQYYRGPHEKRVLDTLFVKLDNPPKSVQIPGLPENVVPIVKFNKTVICVFPSDIKESIERQQVPVLPNFAMTAHAAQGKTRPFNVVHLNSCTSHMAYYSALSRSATANGTIIIQGFDARVITKGCSGYLRQEFRELEILDDVTTLRYEGKLPETIDGHLRNTIIEQYHRCKGKYYVPSKTDAALKWSAADPMHTNFIPRASWQFINKNKEFKNAAFDMKPVSILSKRKYDKTSPPCKRPRIMNMPLSPVGLTWDSENWSCAYDSLLVTLYNFWQDNPEQWSGIFEGMNEHLNLLSHGFLGILNKSLTFEDVRDYWRAKLHDNDAVYYPNGRVGTSVGRLAAELFKTNAVISSSQQICSKCNYAEDPVYDRLGYVVHADQSINTSTAEWIASMSQKSHMICPDCNRNMQNTIFYKTPPHMLVLEYPTTDIQTSHSIIFDYDDNIVKLELRGIVYYGHYHFTSRIISNDKHVWYHDGITTAHACTYEGLLNHMDNHELKNCRGGSLSMAIYVQKL